MGTIKSVKVNLTIINDIDALMKKADAEISNGNKQASAAASIFGEANDILGQADGILLKAQSQAQELGANEVLKTLAVIEKNISAKYAKNNKIISALKSV